jgi:hypothetical protein
MRDPLLYISSSCRVNLTYHHPHRDLALCIAPILTHLLLAHISWSSELDVTILAWKETVHWNRVRPTSLVQALDEEIVEYFAGIDAARDWVPYNISVMPQTEYPSGSTCICLGVADFIDAFLMAEYGDASIATSTWEFSETDSTCKS